MPLEEAKVPIPLGAGVDDSVHPFQLQAPFASVVHNMRPEQRGAYQKRPGFSTLYSPGTPPTAPVLVGGRENLLMLGEAAGGRVINATNDTATATTAPFPMTVEAHRVAAGRGMVHSVQCAQAGAYTGVLWNRLGDPDVNDHEYHEIDYEMVACILDADHQIVWGPYVLPDLKWLPRIEPVDDGKFIFYGCTSSSATIGPSLPAFASTTVTLASVLGGVGLSAPVSSTSYGSIWESQDNGYKRYKLYDTTTTYTTGVAGVAIVAWPRWVAGPTKELRVETTSTANAITASRSVTLSGATNDSIAVFWDAASDSVVSYEQTDGKVWSMPLDLSSEVSLTAPSLKGIDTSTNYLVRTLPHEFLPVFFVDDAGAFRLNEDSFTISGSSPGTPSFSAGSEELLPMLYEPVVANGDTLFSFGGGNVLATSTVQGASNVSLYHMTGTISPAVDLVLMETRLGETNHKLYTHITTKSQTTLLDQEGGPYESPCVTGQVASTGTSFLYPIAMLTSLQKTRANPVDNYDPVLLNHQITIANATYGLATGTDGAGYYNDEQLVALVEVSPGTATSSHASFEGGEIVACGMVSMWDGRGGVLPAALRRPNITAVDTEDTVAAGSFNVEVALDALGIRDISSGTNSADYATAYYVKVVLVYTNASGVEWRSPPSPAFTVAALQVNSTTVPTRAPNIFIQPHPQTLAFIDAGGALDAEIYVTDRYGVVAALDESTYTMVNRSPLITEGTSNYIAIDTLQDLVSYDIDPGAGQEYSAAWRSPPHTNALYSVSGELEPDHPPAMYVLSHAGEYMFGLAAEDPYEIWPTKPLIKGLGPEFSSLLTILAPPESGGVVSLAGSYDRLYALCRNGVWEMPAIGGPDASGLGGFPPFRLVYEGDPCVTHMGTVRTPLGVFYVTEAGPRLIAQDGSIQPVGEAVKDQLDWANCTGSVYVPKDQEVLWFDANGAVAFDLGGAGWSTADFGGSSPAKLGGELALIDSLGGVALQSSSSDNWESSPFFGEVRTPWIAVDGIQGFKRVVRAAVLGRLENKPTSGGLKVTIRYNYSETIVDTFTWTSAEVDALVSGLQLEVGPSRQKCRAIKIGIAEYGTGGETPLSDTRWSLAGITLRVRGKKGLAKLEAGARK